MRIGSEHKTARPARRTIIMILVGVIACAYVAGAVYFSGHFQPHTFINGTEVSSMTPGQVSEILDKQLGEYELVIKERDKKEEHISGKSIGLSYEDDNEAEALLKQQSPGKWPVALFVSTNLTPDSPIIVNRQAIEKTVSNLACFNNDGINMPEDAKLNTSAIPYTITPENEGNAPNVEKTIQVITAAAVNRSEEVDLDAEGAYMGPSVRKNDKQLNARLDAYNTFFSHACTVSFGNSKKEITAEMIQKALSEDQNGMPIFNEEYFAPLVKEWAEEFDTYGKEVIMKNHAGDGVSVKCTGYGRTVDQEATLKALNKAVLEGGTLEPVMSREASWENSSIGNDFIEISLDEQHLWLVKDGKTVLDSDVVTGLPTGGRGTVPGVWTVTEKAPEKEIGVIGTQNNGVSVQKCIGFNGRQGIHSAPWMENFGVDVPAGSRTSGCVAIPEETAEALYELVENGTPVAVY